MAFLRRQAPLELVDWLRRTESDAAECCRRAASAIVGDPLTRGAVLAFALEHEEMAAAWARVQPPESESRTSTDIVWDADASSSPSAALTLLRRQAEIGVRRLGEAMERLSPQLAILARTHRNAWLRHRAWLGARIDAFTRPSVVPSR